MGDAVTVTGGTTITGAATFSKTPLSLTVTGNAALGSTVSVCVCWGTFAPRVPHDGFVVSQRLPHEAPHMAASCPLLHPLTDRSVDSLGAPGSEQLPFPQLQLRQNDGHGFEGTGHESNVLHGVPAVRAGRQRNLRRAAAVPAAGRCGCLKGRGLTKPGAQLPVCPRPRRLGRMQKYQCTCRDPAPRPCLTSLPWACPSRLTPRLGQPLSRMVSTPTMAWTSRVEHL